MANRTVPLPIYGVGMVLVNQGSVTVTGFGTNWTPDLAGLEFQVLGDSAGLASIIGPLPSKMVAGSGTNWSSDLTGFAFQVTGENAVYTVASVHPTAQRLELDRFYEG